MSWAHGDNMSRALSPFDVPKCEVFFYRFIWGGFVARSVYP